MTPTRPALRWHGGKWRLAPWILQHFPPHRIYVEPYGGAGSVLLRKAPSYCDVYNDLDDEVVTFFRVLQDGDQAARLVALLELTPFARREFELAYEPSTDPVELARRLVIRSFMGFGSNAHTLTQRGHRSTGFRANSPRSGTTPALDWRNYPQALAALIERLRGVVIEHRDAGAVIDAHDGAQTLFYLDPTYLPETRSPGNKYDLKYRMYRHELDRLGHGVLLARLRALAGYAVISGYADVLYERELAGWRRVEMPTHADGARDRTEVLWINPRAAAALKAHGSVFAQAHFFEGAA